MSEREKVRATGLPRSRSLLMVGIIQSFHCNKGLDEVFELTGVCFHCCLV